MSYLTEQIEATIAKKRAELSQLEGTKNAAMKMLLDENGERRVITDALFLHLTQFEIGDSGEKAIAILAVCSMLAKQLRAPELEVERYNDALRTISQLEARLEGAS